MSKSEIWIMKPQKGKKVELWKRKLLQRFKVFLMTEGVWRRLTTNNEIIKACESQKYT